MATLLIDRSRRYNCIVVIMNRLTVIQHPLLKWQWTFTRICFLSSITENTFIRLDSTNVVVLLKYELHALREHLFSPQLFVGSDCVANIFSFRRCVYFWLSPFCVLSPMLPVSLDCLYIIINKTTTPVQVKHLLFE